MLRKTAFPVLFTFIAFFNLFCTDVQAQTTKDIRLVCPACNTRIDGKLHIFSPEKLQQDKDLFRYYNGLPYYGSRLSLCPGCGYAGYNVDFKRRLTDAQKEKIKSTLSASVRGRLKRIKERNQKYDVGAVNQDEISAFLKYDHLEQSYKIIGVEDVVLGKLYLEMTWNIRQRLSMPLVLQDTNAALVALNQHLTDSIGMVNVNDLDEWIKRYTKAVKSLRRKDIQFCAHYILSSLHDRKGNFEQAKRSIKRAELSATVPRLKQIAKSNSRLLDTERKYQRLAVKHFRIALEKKKIKKKEIPLIVYLTGELYRRLDEGARAKLWYKAVREIPAAPVRLVEWSKEQYSTIRQMPQSYPGDTALLSIVLNQTSVADSGAVKDKLAKLETRMKILKTRIFLFVSQVETFPDSLKDLELLGYLKRKGDLLCPVTGMPFIYVKPKRDSAAQTMISLGRALPIAYGVRMIQVRSDGEIIKLYHGQ